MDVVLLEIQVKLASRQLMPVFFFFSFLGEEGRGALGVFFSMVAKPGAAFPFVSEIFFLLVQLVIPAFS